MRPNNFVNISILIGLQLRYGGGILRMIELIERDMNTGSLQKFARQLKKGRMRRIEGPVTDTELFEGLIGRGPVFGAPLAGL